ncbi:MAG: G1 family endopeptidase, partial [Chloroflexota bacterium]|nr:G1 family endopeptidase [Chloroflexota bacterium]
TGDRGLPSLLGQASSATMSEAAQTAIMGTIRRANAAQQQALAAGDPTPMRDSSTAAYYEEMQRINSDLTNGGVTAIELVRMDFGQITVNGDNAKATTTETWRSTLNDGTTDETTDRNEYSLVLENGSWKIEGDDHPDSAASGGQGTQPTSPSRTTPNTGVSRNWAGYVATGGSFTSVSGTWTIAQPSATTAGIDATWVGIGGYGSDDLVQAGTQANVTRTGDIIYTAWIERLPQAAQTVPLTVSGGDSVTVALTEQNSGQWLVSITNNATGKSYSTTIRYSSTHASAEWIEEAPSSGRGVVPLDDFGSVRFTSSSARMDGRDISIKDARGKPVTMADSSGQALASPSSLGSDGSSFTVTRGPGRSSAGGGTAPLPGRRSR